MEALNQGKRVNKRSDILNKKNILLTFLIVITIQVNVLKRDLGVPVDPHPDHGYDFVSRSSLKTDLKNDIDYITLYKLPVSFKVL